MSPHNKVLALQYPIIVQAKHLPALWPVTQDGNWLAAQADVSARNIQSNKDLEAFTNRVAVDEPLSGRLTMTCYRRPGTLPTMISLSFKYMPKRHLPPSPRWSLSNHSHVIEHRFVGKELEFGALGGLTGNY